MSNNRKTFFNQAVLSMKQEHYILLVIIMAPILNFLSGLNIDIYAPSMPSIASYFDISMTMVKYTIAITMLGIAIGSIVFGVLIDAWGRKRILVFGLFIYLIASLLAPFSSTIYEIMFIRFWQGAMIASITIGCRALIVDNISGYRYRVAILYTSIGYGLGPVVGPFIGGWLQYYFGWKACFFALGLISITLLGLLIVFVEEKQSNYVSLKFKNLFNSYYQILSNKQFVAAAIIMGLAQVELLTYPTLGPFIVENLLGKSILSYANSALVVGASYLFGTLINRILLKYFPINTIVNAGFTMLFLTLIISYLFVFTASINMLTVTIPIILICFSVGLIFANLMAESIKLFTETTGIAMAIISSFITTIAALGLIFESHIYVYNLLQLSFIYSTLILLQLSFFVFGHRITSSN